MQKNAQRTVDWGLQKQTDASPRQDILKKTQKQTGSRKDIYPKVADIT